MNKRKVFFGLLSFFVFSTILAQQKVANNDWKTIKNSEGKIKLTELKVWGADEKSKEELFKYPVDICRDSKGNYYIADPGVNSVIEFDKNGTYVKNIGRQGAGPGDLNFPVSVAIDTKDNLWVAEMANGRIQMFENGKSKATMNPSAARFYKVRVDKKDRIALKGSSFDHGAAIINMFDYNKKVVGKAGSINNPQKDKYYFINNDYAYSMDKEGNIYLCNTEKQPLIEKYSPDGKPLMKTRFQLSAPLEESKVTRREARGIAITAGGGPKIKGFDVDNNGNIYVLVLQKDFPEGEKGKYSAGFSGSSSKGGGMSIKVVPPKERKDKFDNFAVIIFDKYGNLIGKKTLDYWADEIRVAGGDIFIFDSYLNSVIHQYKLEK